MDKKGKALGDFIDILVVLNDGRGTFLSQNGETSPIDVTLTSPQLALKCTWNVDAITTIGRPPSDPHLCKGSPRHQQNPRSGQVESKENKLEHVQILERGPRGQRSTGHRTSA